MFGHKETIQELKGNLRIARIKATKATNKNVELESAINLLNVQKRQTEDELAFWQKSSVKLEKQVSAIKSDLLIEKQNFENLKREKVVLLNEVDKISKENNKFYNEINSLQTINQELESKVNSLKARIVDLESESDTKSGWLAFFVVLSIFSIVMALISAGDH